MKNLVCVLLFWLTALTSATAADADSLLLQRQENFERFSLAFTPERVYVHFDNTSYYKGENIWYKAYVVRDDNLHRTNLSRILYVELLNPIGYPVETQKLVIENGQANGAFQLKDTLNAGFYEVRAYTQWMLNFTTGDPHGWRRMHSNEARRQWGDRVLRYMQGNAGVFSRVFPVYERVDSGQYSKRRMPRLPKATASMATPVANRLKIDFYPEGGNLVRDVAGRIAFQAHNAEGRTLNVAGVLMRRGDSIGYFRTDYAGRGVFSVTPDSLDAEELTQGLQLKLNYLGHDYSFDLPRPRKRGYALSVFSTGNQLKAVVARNARTAGAMLGLSITSRGHTYYYNTVDLTAEQLAVAMVDKRSLQTGVNIVTVFTTDGKVLAQRQVFVNNHDMDGLHLVPTTSDASDAQLSPYAKVSIDCQLVDTAGRPVRAAHDFSIAVTDRDSRETTYDDNTILSYLLLSSEVKGFIPHPDYYFEADDAEHRQALDELLMVQGWTRYDYEQMLSGRQFTPMLTVERGLTFSGRVWDDNDYHSRRFWKQQGNKPFWVYSELYIDGDTVLTDHSLDAFLYPPTMFREGGKAPQIILTAEARIDSTGAFRFNMLPFYGKGRFALMLNKSSLAEVGDVEGGVPGHNFRWNSARRPSFLMGKRIEPLNQYSPLPKNYDYYETAALVDPMDRDMFRYGFMALPKGYDKQRLTYYNPVSQTYVLPEVQKSRRRRWSDFRDVNPVCVMDVKEMMAWLSNIFGDIQDFKYRDPSPYADGAHMDYEQSNFMARMAMEDARWLDREFNTSHYSAEMMRSLSSSAYKHVDDQPYYINLNELLYIFGLDGMNHAYVNAGITGGQPHYTTATGDPAKLPIGLRFFPVNENFRQLRLYADPDNRRLTHQEGRYHEAIYGYDRDRAANGDHPLTSIFNFITDNTYANTHPLPDFLGFRINFQGLTQPVDFYTPDYDWEPEPEETDYRRTVYWNPQVQTDADGHAHIEFFNNGFSTRLAVSAEGITASGQPIMFSPK